MTFCQYVILLEIDQKNERDKEIMTENEIAKIIVDGGDIWDVHWNIGCP